MGSESRQRTDRGRAATDLLVARRAPQGPLPRAAPARRSRGWRLAARRCDRSGGRAAPRRRDRMVVRLAGARRPRDGHPGERAHRRPSPSHDRRARPLGASRAHRRGDRGLRRRRGDAGGRDRVAPVAVARAPRGRLRRSARRRLPLRLLSRRPARRSLDPGRVGRGGRGGVRESGRPRAPGRFRPLLMAHRFARAARRRGRVADASRDRQDRGAMGRRRRGDARGARGTRSHLRGAIDGTAAGRGDLARRANSRPRLRAGVDDRRAACRDRPRAVEGGQPSWARRAGPLRGPGYAPSGSSSALEKSASTTIANSSGRMCRRAASRTCAALTPCISSRSRSQNSSGRP